MEPPMIEQDCAANFETFMRAAKNGDIALVSCQDAKGRELQVLTVVATGIDNYAYLPFAIMMTPPLYPLMNKIQPPEKLKGEWLWDDDN